MRTVEKKRLAAAMLSALLAGAITLLTTLAAGYLAGKESSLTYLAKLSDPFEKDSLHLRICNLELQNDGGAMLEDIKGVVQFDGQHIVAFKLKGSPNVSVEDSLSANAYRMRIAFLNPMEKLVMAFLLSGSPRAGKPPLVDFRARGISAVSRSSWGHKPFPLYAMLLMAALLAATLSNVLVNRWGNRAGQAKPL